MHIGISGPCSTNELTEYVTSHEHFVPKGLGGTPVNNLAKELVKRGYEVSIFSLSSDVAPGKIEVLRGEKLSIYFGHYRHNAWQRKLDFFHQERASLTHCIKLAKRPDIIHAHWQYEFALPAINSGIKNILTCHDSPIQILKIHKGVYRLVRLMMAIKNLNSFKNINAVSPYAVKQNGLLTGNKIELIPNFEPSWVFDLYEQRKISDNFKVAMINNGFGKIKNVGIGLTAFNLLLKSQPNAELHLFGIDHQPDGPAHIFARKNKITANIQFHGPLHFRDLMQKLSKCNIFLHTAIEESCPMVIIEAMAMGIPVVGGKTSGGVPWMLKDGGGLLVDIRSSEEVCNALEVMSDEEKHKEFSLAARNVALKRYHPDIVINQYLDAYNKALL